MRRNMIGGLSLALIVGLVGCGSTPSTSAPIEKPGDKKPGDKPPPAPPKTADTPDSL